MLLLTLMGVMLAAFLGKAKEDYPNEITVKENGVTESILEVRDLKLNPTESMEYDVNLLCDASGMYHISLDYNETEDGGMKPFVDVTVKVGGEQVYEGKLEELLRDGVVIECEGELQSKEPLVLSICYLMPYDVGNEAQGTYSDFDISITIKKS